MPVNGFLAKRERQIHGEKNVLNGHKYQISRQDGKSSKMRIIDPYSK